jgi:cytokinin dehydrogenase
VRWLRAFYDDFDTFTEDQELLISMPELVDYVEGFVVLNEQSIHSSSIAFPAYLEFNPEFVINGNFKVYYCIEFAINDNQAEGFDVEKVSTSQTNLFFGCLCYVCVFFCRVVLP